MAGKIFFVYEGQMTGPFSFEGYPKKFQRKEGE